MAPIFSVLSLAVLGNALGIRPRAFNVTTSFNNNATDKTLDFESASSCIDSKLSWANDFGSTYISDTVLITSTVWTRRRNFDSYITATSPNDPVAYTLCDGWPRINGTTSVTVISSLQTDTSKSSYITTSPVSMPYPAPNCTIREPLCNILHSAWIAAEETYNASLSAWQSYTATAEDYTIRRPVRDFVSPICGSPTPVSQMWTVGPATCAVQEATVQLLYWPMTRDASQLCQGNASVTTIGPTILGKDNTAEYWGQTLTSPTVYIALDGTWGLTSAGTIYSNHSRVLLPQSPAAVSSMCGVVGGGFVPQPFNYADLAGPPPASAYRCQPKCVTNSYKPQWVNRTSIDRGFTLGDITVPDSTKTYLYDIFTGQVTENLCSTIWNDYKPALSIPSEFSTMSPVWYEGKMRCGFNFDLGGVFYDPPKALIRADSIAGPSLPVTTPDSTRSPDQATPDPGNVPGPGTPAATKTPDPKPDPPAQPTAVPEPSKPAQSQAPPIAPPIAPPNPQQSDEGDPVPVPEQPGNARPPTASASPSYPAVKPAAPSQPAATRGPTTRSIAIGLVITASNGDKVTAIQVQPSGPVVIGSDAMVTPGQSTSYDGIGNIIANSDGLNVDGSTRPFTAIATGQAVGAILTAHNGEKVTASQLFPSGPVLIGDSILLPGEPTNVAGIGKVSILPNGILIEGKLVPFIPINPNQHGFFTAPGTIIPAGATSAVILAPGITLQPGGSPVSFSGHSISLGPGGAFLVIDGSTQWSTLSPTTAADGFTMAGQTYTKNDASAFVLDGKTLTPGGVAAISGVEVAFDSSGSYVVVNGVTQILKAFGGLASGAGSTTFAAASTIGLGGAGPGSSDPADESGAPALASSSAVAVSVQFFGVAVALGVGLVSLVLV